jgi:hypothetical protein
LLLNHRRQLVRTRALATCRQAERSAGSQRGVGGSGGLQGGSGVVSQLESGILQCCACGLMQSNFLPPGGCNCMPCGRSATLLLPAVASAERRGPSPAAVS